MKLITSSQKELNLILNIISEAQESLKSYNIDQWQNGYPNREVILEDIAKAQGYSVYLDNELIAYLVISFDGEPDYDVLNNGTWLKDAKYAVIHRLCLSKKYKGQKLSKEILSLAHEYVLAKGFSYIRIDTHEDNFIMHNLLINCGYHLAGEIVLGRDNTLRNAYDIIL